MKQDASVDRRTFVARCGRTAGAFAIGGPAVLGAAGDDPRAAGGAPRPPRAGASGVLLRGGLVVDGTGSPPFRGDVRIVGDTVAEIGRGLDVGAAEPFDARDLVVAPGFVDIHSHTDLGLFRDPRAESKIRQGVTTEVTGADGGSIGPWSPEERERRTADLDPSLDFHDLGGFFLALERSGMAPNVASMVGAGTVRQRVVGLEDRPPTDAELARMAGYVAAAVDAGACGLSSGLEYLPGGFASTSELIALARVLAGTGLPYASHMRNEDDTLLAAVEEAIAVGARAGVPAHISHLKALGARNWWKAGAAFDLVERALEGGADVSFDVYPYTAYGTSLGATLFPLWAREGGTDALIDRLNSGDAPALEQAAREKVEKVGSWDAFQVTGVGGDGFAFAVGRRLGALAEERGEDPYALVRTLITEDRNAATVAVTAMSEENVAAMIAHPAGMVCSDAGARATDGPLSGGSPHPRTYGSFPRLLGKYVREERAIPLEAAIAKITGAPARRLCLRKRGVLAPGMAADVVLFDPATIADRATFEQPHRYPVGLPHVIVNGAWVLRDGERTGELPGRVVRPGDGA